MADRIELARPAKRWAVLAVALATCAPLAQATPEPTYLFPAGGMPGATVETTVGGKFPEWPVQVECTSEQVTVEPLEEKGKLRIVVADDATPGPIWLRFYDKTGAALPRPWIVDPVAAVVETEENDRPSQAQEISLAESTLAAVVVDGRLEKSGDVDVYRVDVPAGKTLVADLDAHVELTSPMDGVLQVLRPDGFVAAQNDDQHALDPRLAVPIDHAGVWMVRVFGFPATPNQSIQLAGSDAYVYRLTLSTGPVVDYALPLAASRAGATTFALHGWNLPEQETTLVLPADDQSSHLRLADERIARTITVPVAVGAAMVEPETTSLEEPADVALPVSITGRIATDGDEDAYRWTAVKGDVVSIRVASRALGYAVDPVVRLLDDAGKQLARVDDVGAQRDAELTHTVAADGPLRVVVSDLFGHGGPHFVYRLALEKLRPGFSLSSAAHQVVVKQGEKAEVTIGVVRQAGFNEAVDVSIEGLPEGVAAAAQQSVVAEGSKTADKVVLSVEAAADAPPVSTPIRIRSAAESAPPSLGRFDTPGSEQGLSEIWLTVVAGTDE